jgi:hypothetical protein
VWHDNLDKKETSLKSSFIHFRLGLTNSIVSFMHFPPPRSDYANKSQSGSSREGGIWRMLLHHESSACTLAPAAFGKQQFEINRSTQIPGI